MSFPLLHSILMIYLKVDKVKQQIRLSWLDNAQDFYLFIYFCALGETRNKKTPLIIFWNANDFYHLNYIWRNANNVSGGFLLYLNNKMSSITKQVVQNILFNIFVHILSLDNTVFYWTSNILIEEYIILTHTTKIWWLSIVYCRH